MFLSSAPKTPCAALLARLLCRLCRLCLHCLLCLPFLAVLPAPAGAQRDAERDEEGLRPQAIRILRFHPNTDRLLYAGTAGWGVQLSTDGGATWQPSPDELAAAKIESLAFHRSEIWIATRSRGVYRAFAREVRFPGSADEGLGAAQSGPLAVSAGDELTVFFAGTRGSGLFRSLDGRSWSLVGTFLPAGVGALHVDPGNPSVILAEAGSLYRSDDQGESWHRVPDAGGVFERMRLRALARQMQTSMAGVGRLCRSTIPRFVHHPEKPGEIWLARCTGLQRSEDGGRIWEGVENVPPIPVFDLAIDPLSPAHMVLATLDGLVETRNGGRTWEITRRAPVGVAVSAVTFAGNGTLLAGTTGGELVHVSFDGTVTTTRFRQQQATYRPTPEEIERLRRERTMAPYERAALAARPTARPTIRPGIDVHVAALVSHPDVPDLLWAGTRVGVFHSRDGGETWRPSSIGLGELEISDLEIDASGASTPGDEDRVMLWAATRGGGVYRSPSSGRAWFPASRGLDDAVVRDLLQAPEDPLELWAATADAGVFHTVDGGRTWRPTSDGLDEPGVRTLAFAGGRLWAGTDAGDVYFSDDRGGAWERTGDLRRPRLEDEGDLSAFRRLGVEPGGLHVRDLLGDPDDDETLLAATLFGLFRTEDGGRSWEWTSLRLGVHGLLRHPHEEETILAATTRGLWGSRDAGESWRLVPFADPAEPFSPSREDDGPEHALPPLFALAVARDGDVLVGTDRGEVLRASDGLGEWQRVSLLDPDEVRPASARFAPPPEEPMPPDEDPELRARRDATLLAAAFDGVLGSDLHRPRRLDVLLAHEAVRRQEIPAWPRELLDRLGSVERRELLRDDVTTRVLRRAYSVIEDRQRAFADGWGVTSLRFGPRGRLLAVGSATDDGRRILSEIRVFDPSERYLLSPDLLRRLGPSPYWKVLHDLGRKPAVVRPGWVLDGAGPILRWDRSRLLVTRPADDRVALWDLAGDLGRPPGAVAGGVGDQPRSVGPRTVRGFPAPARTATLSADARWLAVADFGGGAWVKDLAGRRPLERVYFDPREIPPEPELEPETEPETEADGASDEIPEPTPIDAAYATPHDVVLFSPAGVVAHRLTPRGVVYDDPEADGAAGEADATSRRLFGLNGGFDDLVADRAGRWVVAVPRTERRAGDGETAALLLAFDGGVATRAHVLDSGRAASWQVTVSPDGRYLAVSHRGAGHVADSKTRIFDLSGDLEAEGPARVIDEEPMAGVRFSPDGRHVAFRGEEGEEIWALGGSGNVETGLVPPSLDALVEDLLGHDPVEVAEWFFDDADRSFVGSARLPRGWVDFDRDGWDEHGARGLLRTSSPDGRWLAAAGPGRLLQLWHFGAESLGHLQPPTGATVLDLRRFRPYPSTHATPVDLWPLAGERLEATGGAGSLLVDVCRAAGRNFTAEEWEHYFGDEPYRRICALGSTPPSSSGGRGD